MRTRKNVHYEIMAQRGTGWTILGIRHNEKEAIDVAKKQRKAGGFQAVRVMRERFDAKSNTFSTNQVYFEGREAKSKGPDAGDGPLTCWRPTDFYSVEGRRTIGRLLRDELARWRLTPTELVHHPAHVERLEDSGGGRH